MNRSTVLLAAAIAAVALLVAPAPLAAQEDDEFSGTYDEEDEGLEEDTEVRFREETVLDFEDLLLEGEVRKPQGATIVERQELRFDNLIRERENFEPEMIQSVDLLR